MAVSTAQKQEWLIAQGKPKSYSYFMTGGTMPPDWDWNAAISGSYTPTQVDGFLSDGDAAYAAGKAKAKKKKASNPGGPSVGPATSCAKTASKQIVSWVNQAADNAVQWFNKAGIKAWGGEKILVEASSFRKVLTQQIKDATAELGDQADDVIALKQARALVDHVEVARNAELAAEQVADAWTIGDTDLAIGGLDALRAMAGMKAPQIDKAVAVFEAQFGQATKNILQNTVDNATKAILRSQSKAVGRTWQQIAIDYGDEWDDLLMKPILGKPSEEAAKLILDQIALDQLDGSLLTNASTIYKGLGELDDLTRLWIKQTTYDGSSWHQRRAAFEWMGEVGDTINNSTGQYVNAYNDLADSYKLADWWQEGPHNTLEGSPIEKWVTVYGKDTDAAIIGESETISKLTKSLGDMGVWGDIDAGTDIASFVTQQGEGALSGFNVAFGQSKGQLPGLVATKADVIAKLDAGYVATIKATGTDDLNKMVQAKLVDNGESKSMTYYMTKEQKIDYILLPKETFDETPYQMTWTAKVGGEKQTIGLQGNGLETSKQKLSIKKGVQTPQTPAQAAKEVKPSVADPVTGAIDTFSAPPNSPPWWTDPMSDAQQYVIEKELKLQGGTFYEATQKAPDHIKVKLTDGSMTKGQASKLISPIKEGKVDWTVADLEEALTYGQKKAVTVVDDAVKAKLLHDAEPLVEDISDAVKAVSGGPAVSGSVQTTSTAAPTTAAWDAPHTFTYVGDGKRKWGGAHRKWHFTDEDGNDWMLKNGDKFRLDGEYAAHKIGNLAGFDIAEARVTTQLVDGRRTQGFMQKMYRKTDVVGELEDSMRGGSFVGLDDQITRQVQEHQVLDWLMGNHDGHKQNFLVMKDGRVVGIDKGQAFKFLGKDELSATYSPNGNFGEIAYNRMWKEFRAGQIDIDLDSIGDALRRVEAITDEAYEKAIREYAQGRFAAGRSAGFLQGTSAKNVDEFVELALERKRNIRKDFTAFYKENARARGIDWTPSWADDVDIPKAAGIPKKVVKPGEVLTPIDDEFTAGLQRAGTAGKTIYVSGTDVERGQILFDIVADSKGNQVLRMHTRMRPDADAKIMKLLQEEGGDAVGKVASIAPPPTTPNSVIQLGPTSSTVTQGAKTINHHISTGDFQFNQGTISEVKAYLSNFEAAEDSFKVLGRANLVPEKEIDKVVQRIKGLSLQEQEAALERAFDDLAALATQRKAQNLLKPHMEGIIEQAAKGDAAAKVPFTPSFDGVQEYMTIKQAAIDSAKKKLAGQVAEQVVDIAEPEKVFTSVQSGAFRTTKTQLGDGVGPDQRIARLVSDKAEPMGGGSRQTLVSKTDDGVEFLYSPHNANQWTDKGYVEVLVRTDGEVTTADVQKAYKLLSEKVGVGADLADSEQMELTYWRLTQGTYRNSRDASTPSSKYYKALTKADENLANIGPNPTPAQEIEAIRSAYVDVFGAHVRDADYLPIHDHALASHLEEIGWGRFARPEVTADDLAGLDDYIATHHITSGRLGEVNFKGAMRDGLQSGSERRRIGFWADSNGMSAAADVESGGASSMFMRIGQDRGVHKNYVITDVRANQRYLGNYNSNQDRYGNLKLREQLNNLSPGAVKNNVNKGSNELMMRDAISWVDQVEVAFFDTADGARAAQKVFKDAGLGVLRGIPVEERFVYSPSPGNYMQEFRRKYLRGKLNPIRWTAEEIKSGASKAKQVVAKAANLTRMKVKGTRLAKKLSAGRPEALQVSNIPAQSGQARNWGWISSRKHTVENAVSLSVTDMKTAGWIIDESEDLVEQFMQGIGIKVWAHGGDQAFKIGRSTRTQPSVVIDLGSYGVDLKDFGKYEQERVLRDFVQAINDNNLDDFTNAWAAGA